MNSQDIFKAIITDDNVSLLESVYSVLYEKSNILVEECRIIVGKDMLSENDYKYYGSADPAVNAQRRAAGAHNSELDKLHADTKKRMKDNPESTHAYKVAQRNKKLDLSDKLKSQKPEDRSKNAERLMKNSQRREGYGGRIGVEQRTTELKNKTREYDTKRLEAGKVTPKGAGQHASVVTGQKSSNAARSSLKLDQPQANRRNKLGEDD
jgi:hypothetical protein